MSVRIRVATLVLLVLAPLAHASGVYKWKDANGVTHFSDAPPPKGQYQEKDMRPQEGAAPAATPAPVAAPAARPAAAPPAPRSTAPAIDPALAAANCATAKGNLERLSSGGNIGMDENGDGQPDSVLSADQVAQQTEVTNRQIKTFCGASNP